MSLEDVVIPADAHTFVNVQTIDKPQVIVRGQKIDFFPHTRDGYYSYEVWEKTSPLAVIARGKPLHVISGCVPPNPLDILVGWVTDDLAHLTDEIFNTVMKTDTSITFEWSAGKDIETTTKCRHISLGAVISCLVKSEYPCRVSGALGYVVSDYLVRIARAQHLLANAVS